MAAAEARRWFVRFVAIAIVSLPSCRSHELPSTSPPAAALATPQGAASSPPSLALALASGALAGKAFVDPQPSLPDAPRSPGGAADARASLAAPAADGRIPVDFPLEHTKVYAQIAGNVARVEVQQLYKNPTNDRLEAVYAFPLPANAAVTDMYFRIGRRVVFSEVRRRGEARRTYEAARRAGKTAALTEQERPNLFTQSVANIPPGEAVAVVLRYVHEVPFDDGRYLYVFPTTVGPKYIPGQAVGQKAGGFAADTDRVPDASRVTPPVLPPAFRSRHDVEVLVRLTPGAAFHGVGAKSHRVVTGLDGDGGRVVALAEDDRIPNKDFVLAYRPAGDQPEAHLLVEREKGEHYLMLFVQPPVDVLAPFVRPKEMVFLLDKSGSMYGKPMDTAKGVILEALRRMGPDDTFQLVAFDGAAAAMSDKPLSNAPENVSAAEAWLDRLQGGGGTEMLEGIVAALTPPADPKRLRMVVFCTDGFIGNEAEIIEAVGKLRGSARVFGFGIGTSVNRYLVEGVARAGRGAAEIVSIHETVGDAVGRLYKRLDRPILTDLELSFEGVPVRDLLPERLPDLFAGQPLVVVGRIPAGADLVPPPKGPVGNGSTAVVLHGRLGSGPYLRRLTVSTGPHQAEAPVVGTLWARRRIEDLTTRRPTRPEAAEIDEIVGLALRFKLITAYTSFVAVERELLADPGLPLTTMIVPNQLPEGVSYEGIFGEPSATTAEVLPARVKPGDPEIRVKAPASASAVRVGLPFGEPPIDATYDAPSGEHVARFLVPSGWPDGSYEARIEVIHADGRTEARAVAIRVDTTPAAVAVLSAPATVKPGEVVELELKPALPLPKLASVLAAGAPGGRGNALKGAMEVKEILVRAPWGEVARARMDGPLGIYRVRLHAPADAAGKMARFEIVASDAAGNVARRTLDVSMGEGRTHVSPGLLGVGLVAAALAGVGLLARRRARAASGCAGVVGPVPVGIRGAAPR